MIGSLQNGKASGPDLINNRILKETADEISTPLCTMFNLSVSSGQFPSIWKEANVTPIFKKDDPSLVSKYRPISLLSTVGKLLVKTGSKASLQLLPCKQCHFYLPVRLR